MFFKRYNPVAQREHLCGSQLMTLFFQAPNEALYQCSGDCYEEWDPRQRASGDAVTPCTCHASRPLPSDHITAGDPSLMCSNSSPEATQPHAGVMTPKFTTNPNRYQNTPPRRSQEHLYNELDPRHLSDPSIQQQHSPDTRFRHASPHHYEVYESGRLRNITTRDSRVY